MTTRPATRRTRIATLMAALLVAATAAVGTGQPAAAVDAIVRAGQTVALPESAGAFDVRIDPPVAGTVQVLPDVILFTAAFDAEPGFVTITFQTPAGTNQRIVTIVGERAGVGGSFVPVPDPGPCLLITDNRFVAFGETRLGGDWKTSTTQPRIEGCAEPDVVQDIQASASDARSDISDARLTIASCDYAACAPSTGTYAVAIPQTTQGQEDTLWRLVLGSQAATLLPTQAGNFPSTDVSLALKLPPTLAVGLGQLFTFDVTLTAVAA